MVSPACVVVAACIFDSALGLNVASHVRCPAREVEAAGGQSSRQNKLAPGVPPEVRATESGLIPVFPAVNRYLDGCHAV
jgi:hypothetical protein